MEMCALHSLGEIVRSTNVVSEEAMTEYLQVQSQRDAQLGGNNFTQNMPIRNQEWEAMCG